MWLLQIDFRLQTARPVARHVTFHGACQGLGGLPRGPMGMWGVTRPARPTDTGDGPGSASGAGVAGATPAAVCGPQRGMACEMHRCRKHRCTGSGMGRHPNEAHRNAGAHTAHAMSKHFIMNSQEPSLVPNGLGAPQPLR